MNDPIYEQWKIRCEFRGFCRKVLYNEAINAYNEIRNKRKTEVSLSDLTQEEIKELSTYDKYFE
ncbi:MAG: RNA polymerase subunit sigma, partial [Clostridiales bacterium]|nr:RNA polymerase subunit sigma [Clostridiales bacterium]